MDGQEALGEDEKAAAMKKARFTAITKTFFDPEGFILHTKQMERERATSKNCRDNACSLGSGC